MSDFWDDLNPIDTEDIKRFERKAKGEAEKLDYLIHKVFEQSPEGKELLSIWKESLIMKPHADGGMSYVDIGIREGMDRFIRGIILTVKRVEEQ